jgi:hypothetical protein
MMSGNAILLYRALQNVEQELERLGRLINAQRYTLPDHLQGELETIRTLFSVEWRALRDTRLEIVNHISQAEINKAWIKYAHLRYERLPKLTGELLTAIGGIHLRQVKLDTLGDLDKEDSNKNVSFTDVADHLVSKDLRERSGLREHDLPMLLIVAEERYEASDASILRLRFPAFDIWHLPFVAYEFGYHFARKANEVALRRLRDDINDRVDPMKYYVNFDDPEDAKCYLSEVQIHWRDFSQAYRQIREPEMKRSFWESRRSKIEALQNRQLVIFCRLLADAFATFYVGPAYTYSLLHLSFSPIKVATGNASVRVSLAKEDLQSVTPTATTWDRATTLDNSTLAEQPVSPWMPPFLQRLVVSLETLRWMKDAAALGSQHFFNDTIDSLFVEDPIQTGILSTYYRTCMAIHDLKSAEGLKECYADTKRLLEPWLKKFQDLFSGQQKVQESTVANWNHTEDLLNYLQPETMEKLEIHKEFNLWEVVNAAWHARHLSETSWKSDHPSQTSKIEQRAMELIIETYSREANGGVAGQQLSGKQLPSFGIGQGAQQLRASYIINMYEVLNSAIEADAQDAVTILKSMLKDDKFRQSNSVRDFINNTLNLENGDRHRYLKAYDWLVSQDDPKAEPTSDRFAQGVSSASRPAQLSSSALSGRRPHETRSRS